VPIRDVNEVDPQEDDVISTIDVYIQDIAHHALLNNCKNMKQIMVVSVVMETKTGKVRAIANLGRANDGTYYETTNYAVAESHEPGSTFKLVDLMAILEQSS
jgi:cell division protein FtsI (penicillin-binding protein 3)